MLFKQNARAETPATTAADNAPSTKLPLPASAAAGLTAPAARAMPESRPASESRSAIDDNEIGKRLIVGKGIQLKGEITACDRLVVEGQVEVTMNATRTLEIKPSGHFIGSCEVEEAEVSGIYDGDLTVRGRLIVHSEGRVTGKICYGELELERGGQIAGELSVRALQKSQGSTQSGGSQPTGGGRRNAA